MKNKRSLIISSVAVLGVIAAIGTSFSLYLVNDSATITIGGITAKADINYGISEITTTSEAISPASPTATYEFNVWGETTTDNAFPQSYALANITVTITPDTGYESITADDALTADLEIEYNSGTYFASDAASTLNSITNWSRDVTTGALTGSVETYIYVSSDSGVSNTSSVDLTLTLDEGITGADFINGYAEASYSIDVVVSQATNFNVGYVVGSMTSWEAASAYEMVANIEATEITGYEWMWIGELEAGTTIKAIVVNGTTIWSYGNDYFITTTGTYQVYWNGYDTSEITVVAY